MFVARGTGEDSGLGETGKITRDVANEIPGSTAYAINYPASFLEVNYFLSVSNGTEMLKQSIERYAQTCPGHKMALFGYSQGAQITSNNMCGQPHVWSLAGASLDDSSLPRNLTKDIVSVVLFGDPTHNENSEYNYGSGEESGVFYRNPKDNACEDLGSRIRSYCDTGDIFCDVGSKVDEAVHLSYVNKYKDEVVEFVVERYRASPDDGQSPNASSTATPDSQGTVHGIPQIMAVVSVSSFLGLMLF